MKKIFTWVACFMLLLMCKAQSQAVEFELADFAVGLDQPLDIQNAGDQRLYVVEKPGRIMIVRANGSVMSEPFLDITDRVKSNKDEQGLLGLAFHPHYKQNGYFYVHYTNKHQEDVIARYQVSNDPRKAKKSSEVILLTVNHPFENHNSGCLAFGPDGFLYIGMGDGGSAGDPKQRAQDPTQLLGKILRIDVDQSLPGGPTYGIPDDNPYVGVPGYRPEIWALGVRNPFRFSFDRLTGDLFIGDVGQDLWEEVDYQPALSNGGQNYGWDCYEGLADFEPGNCTGGNVLTFPIITYAHENGNCTVIGGYVYRGTTYPSMFGKYFFMDYCSGTVKSADQINGEWTATDLFTDEPFEYVSFGQGDDGELYVASITGGEVYHLQPVPEKAGVDLMASDVSLFPNPNNGTFNVSWTSSGDEDCVIEVQTLLGQSLLSQTQAVQKGTNNFTFTLPSGQQGSYLFLVHSKQGEIVKKFSVE